jgi:hypothetical protein
MGLTPRIKEAAIHYATNRHISLSGPSLTHAAINKSGFSITHHQPL